MEEFLSDTHLIDGKQYCIYGNTAYSLRPWLLVGFPIVSVTDEEQLYNSCMSAVREAIRLNYKEIKFFFPSQDMKRKLKCRKTPIALMYISAALLFNFKTCLRHKGQIATWFECQAPSLSEYLGFANPEPQDGNHGE